MKRSAGFSLIEMMVALTLGIIVMGAVLASFAGSRTASRSTVGISAVTDGGRFAISTLTQAIRGAGFMACSAPSPPSTLNVATPAPVMYNFSQPISGFEAAGTGVAAAIVVPAASVTAPRVPDGNAGDWVGGLDGQILGQPVQGTDVIAVHTTVPGTAPAYVTGIASGTDNFTVNSAANLAVGQVAAISDCTKSMTFVITGLGGLTVLHDAGGAGPGNINASFSTGAGAIDFEPGSQVQPVTTAAYYIGVGADGDGALFSKTMSTAGAFTLNELVPDVENMQVLYGIDTVGGGTVTQYVTADLVPNWNAVLAVKIAVLVASPLTATQPPTVAATFQLLGTSVTAPLDSRRRQVFTTSIAMRNMVH